MNPIRHLASLAAVALVMACGGKDDSAATNRQIDLAPSKDAPPQLADVPAPAPKPEPAKAPPKAATKAPQPKPEPEKAAAPAPQAAAPAPAPAAAAPAAPAAPVTGTVAAGSAVTLKPSARICTNTHRAGDRFTATLASAVPGSNGAEIPAGATAVLRVVEASKATGAANEPKLAYDVISIRIGDETYEVTGHVTETPALQRVGTQSTGDKAKKIGAGAAIGAIAGQLLGRNTKSTVIGGAVGAAAGAVAVASSETYEGCIAENGTIAFALDKPLTIRVSARP